MRTITVLILITTAFSFGESLKTVTGKQYCKSFETPKWDDVETGFGAGQPIHELEYRQDSSKNTLFVAPREIYGARKYRLDLSAAGNVSLVSGVEWQTGNKVTYSGLSVLNRDKDRIEYAGRIYPRTGKHWGEADLTTQRRLLAVSSFTGTLDPIRDDYFGIPIWAAPIVLPVIIFEAIADANRRRRWFVEIYDVETGQKLVGLSGKSRGVGNDWSGRWLTANLFLVESGSRKHLTVCDFGSKTSAP